MGGMQAYDNVFNYRIERTHTSQSITSKVEAHKYPTTWPCKLSPGAILGQNLCKYLVLLVFSPSFQ